MSEKTLVSDYEFVTIISEHNKVLEREIKEYEKAIEKKFSEFDSTDLYEETLQEILDIKFKYFMQK